MTDTRDKRASAINVACPWRATLPAPDGTVDDGDRQAAAFLYSGVPAGTAAATGSGIAEIIWRRRLENL